MVGLAGRAEVTFSARVVDETGEAVAGARVELRTPDGRNVPMTYTYQSPEVATVQRGPGSNLNLNGDALNRSIINPAGAANVGSGVVGYTATGRR